MVPAHLMGQLFNILVCGLGFLSVNHMDVVILDGLANIACDFISIKYQNQGTFFIALIITENIHQLMSCPVNGRPGKFI